MPHAFVGESASPLVQFVKQLVEKGNVVHATVRHEGNGELQWLQRKNENLSIGIVDVTDSSSIKVSPLTAIPPFRSEGSMCHPV